jgi:outer membrane receptor protein involved in Fe transport
VSIDYYKIKLSGAIQTLTNQQMLNECQAGDTTICGFIARDATGKLISITSTFDNLARITTSGFDFEASYRFNLGSGKLDLRVLGNYLKDYIVDTGTTRINYAGDILTFGIPKWGWDFGAAYRAGGSSFLVDARRLGNAKYSIASASQIENNDVAGVWYLGAGIEQKIGVKEGEFTVYARVDNLLDEKPPLFFPAANAGGNFDRIGRYFKFGVRIKM